MRRTAGREFSKAIGACNGYVRRACLRSKEGYVSTNPQAGDVSPPRPPEIVGPDVLQAGDLPELPVRVLELPGIVVEGGRDVLGRVGIDGNGLELWVDASGEVAPDNGVFPLRLFQGEVAGSAEPSARVLAQIDAS